MRPLAHTYMGFEAFTWTMVYLTLSMVYNCSVYSLAFVVIVVMWRNANGFLSPPRCSIAFVPLLMTKRDSAMLMAAMSTATGGLLRVGEGVVGPNESKRMLRVC